ncbi:MAG: pyridoxal-phosphate dependent enzyme [Oligoflexia bacterium]|nr:pyridoxal-phosphate dependent enzyme [Oligoflexia bacterium]
MNLDISLSYNDLITEGGGKAFNLGWEKTSGGVNKIVFPKCLTGTEANIIVLLPDHFPTCSPNDATAFFTLKYMMDNKRISNNTVEVCAFDSAMPAYAWVCSVLDLKCIIRTHQQTSQYWIKRAQDYGAEIKFEGVNNTEATKIIDANKTKTNFVSQFNSLVAYTYHRTVTREWVNKAVMGMGNNKVVLFAYPASSGSLTGAAASVKSMFPYSKNLLVEPSSCPTFYNNKKGSHKIGGMGYGFIPFIHNILATDYVMTIDDEEIIKSLKCIEEYSDTIISQFNADSKTIKPIVEKLGLSTIACIIASINLAQQLYLKDDDNIVVLAEDSAMPYHDLFKSVHLGDIDVRSTLEEAFLSSRYIPILDVTGQRQRERLFKKKKDYWVKRGIDEKLLDEMREPEFWENLPGY